MNVSEEQLENIRMIRESASAFASRESLKRVRESRYKTPGFSRDIWLEMAENGWIGLALPEALGGSGLGAPEYCALQEVLGAALVPEPLIAGVLAARMLEGTYLAQQLSGEKLILLAWQESVNTLASDSDKTRIEGGRVTGRKRFVPMAAGADGYLVTTSTGMILIDADAEGLSVDTVLTQDGGHFGTLRLSDVPGEEVPLSPDALCDAIDEAALATGAYLLGVAERAFEITLDYLGIRKQFGKVIGSFQALQHRAVDLKLQLALTRASLENAALTWESDANLQQRRAAVSQAKVRAVESASLVTREAIQLHGAIGYTDEYDVGLYLRKAMTLANLYGSAATHRRRFAEIAPRFSEA
jgi:alkylation response protein AidB-like acyl-CoA dehydrogenase